MVQEKLKTVTIDVVKDYCEKISEKLGYVTTLDIKNELRKDGFWAVQSDISNYVEELSIENNWDWGVEFNYKVYYIKPRTINIIKMRRYLVEKWIRENTKNKFFGVLFIKKDNTERKMVCRLGVAKGAKGTAKYDVAASDKWNHILRVFDVNVKNDKDPNIKGDYRNISLDTLKEVRFKDTIIHVID